jgi:hypothetical protein
MHLMVSELCLIASTSVSLHPFSIQTLFHSFHFVLVLIATPLQQLGALEKDVDLDNAELNSSHQDLRSRNEAVPGDIAKDLNKIKRQNMITHVLLGTVIVMTAAWQVNEVSFLLAVQKKLSNPFKSLGDMIKGALKRGGKPMIEASPLPPVGVPDVTRTDLPMAMLAIGNS